MSPDVQDPLRQIVETMPDGVVIIDENWTITFANQRGPAILKQSEMIGHNLFTLFPGNREEPFYSTYKRAMEERVEGSFEAFQSEPVNLWLQIAARPLQGGGIIVFFSDVTPRKEAELREQSSAQRLREVLEVSSDAVVSLDRAWRYTYLNANAQRIVDPEHKLLGRNIWEEFPHAVGTEAYRVYQRAMNEGVAGSTEIFYPQPLNAWLYVQAEPAPDGIVVFFRDITEQKTHDDVVRSQQELLAVVQRAARLVTWDLDPATGDIAYGAGSFQLSGHPRAQLNSVAKIERIVQREHAGVVGRKIAEALSTGEMVTSEFPVTASGGSLVWLESRGQAVRLADGSTRIRGMSIDVTKRRRDQAELVASEERYRVLADLNPQAIWMGDAAGNITYANQGFMNYLGLTADDLGGAGWLNAFAPFERDRVLRVWLESVTTGVDYDVEAMMCQAATGEYCYWHLRAAPVRDAAGQILHWLGVANDIHASKTYAASLRAEQMETERKRAELEALYASTPVALALLDPVEYRFLNCNDYEAQMLGMTKSELVGRPLSEVAPPDKFPALRELLRSVAAGATVKDYLLEGALAGRPGESRAWSLNYSPVFNEDGTVRAISTALVEITNQKRSEAALIQSEKLAAVGRLASSISHEINNPLEAITNLLYLIAIDEKLPDALKIYVHMAQSELQRVSQIATQTLRFHRQAVNATHVTPQELVGAVLRLYTGRLANSSIKVDARYDTQTKVLCFENDIRQVLNNLIANAIDATRSGGRLLVRAHAVHQDSRAGVRITIADTGHGMSPEVLARIFEPFYTTKDLQGTGLGLWISHGIVERHQGRLTVRSSEHPVHHGTIFSLFLPCEEK